MCDGPESDQEWRDFLGAHDFGQVIAAGLNRAQPVITPTHFILTDQQEIELHVRRLNPLIQAIAERSRVSLAAIAAHVYVPTDSNADADSDPMCGPPTSYYAAVQARGRALVVDDPEELACLINRQMRHFQPEGGYHTVAPGPSPFGKMLGAIRGIRIVIESVDAKFKFGGNRTPDDRRRIAEHLATRGGPHDTAAVHEQLRRERYTNSS